MNKIISFKAAKKRASYAAKDTKAAENRTKFGRSKTEKLADEFTKNKAAKHLDAHELDDE